MSNPFASIETSLNAVLAPLANATARISGTFVDGIYDSRYINRLDMASSGPAFTVRSADLPDGVTYGTSVSITYNNTTVVYTVAESQADGAGVTVLLLK